MNLKLRRKLSILSDGLSFPFRFPPRFFLFPLFGRDWQADL